MAHANRYFPLTSTDHSVDDYHDYKLIQYKLSQLSIRKQVKVSLKEKNELKNLYAQWICKELQPLTIVEDYDLESFAIMFVKIGKKIDRRLIPDLISTYNFRGSEPRGITKISSRPAPRPVLSRAVLFCLILFLKSRPVPRPAPSRLVPPNSYLQYYLAPFHYLMSTKFFSSFLSIRETASNPYFLVQ